MLFWSSELLGLNNFVFVALFYIPENLKLYLKIQSNIKQVSLKTIYLTLHLSNMLYCDWQKCDYLIWDVLSPYYVSGATQCNSHTCNPHITNL